VSAATVSKFGGVLASSSLHDVSNIQCATALYYTNIAQSGGAAVIQYSGDVSHPRCNRTSTVLPSSSPRPEARRVAVHAAVHVRSHLYANLKNCRDTLHRDRPHPRHQRTGTQTRASTREFQYSLFRRSIWRISAPLR
jgi:hypothetical protein